MLRVHSIETFGTHEGPGIRFVVFLQGCQLRCLYCQNPDSWAMNAGQDMHINDLIKKLEEQREYSHKNGGITVSGGEPLMQREALFNLFAEAKKLGYHTALDTNGSVLDEKSKKLLEVTDLVLLDIKHINPKLHLKLTGIQNTIPLKFAAYCEEISKKMWLRYVLVPGHSDQEEYLHEWAKQFKDYKAIERVEILPYHKLGAYKYEALGILNPLKDVKPPTPGEIEKAKKIFSTYFKTVSIR